MKQANRRSFRLQLSLSMLALLMILVTVFGVEASVYAKKGRKPNNPITKVTILVDRITAGYDGVDVVAAVDGVPSGHCLQDGGSVAVDSNQKIYLYGTKGNSPESGLCFHDGPAKSYSVDTSSPFTISYP